MNKQIPEKSKQGTFTVSWLLKMLKLLKKLTRMHTTSILDDKSFLAIFFQVQSWIIC